MALVIHRMKQEELDKYKVLLLARVARVRAQIEMNNERRITTNEEKKARIHVRSGLFYILDDAAAKLAEIKRYESN